MILLTNDTATVSNIVKHLRSDSAIRSLAETHVIRVTELLDALMGIPALRHSEIMLSLRQMLEWTTLALHLYKSTPLAATLNGRLVVQLEICLQVLRQLFVDLVDPAADRYALSAAIARLIQCMRSVFGESGATSAANRKLQECHTSIASCILALTRAKWPQLQRLPGVDVAALAAFYGILERDAAHLQHIKIDVIYVIDHLNRTLPVPTMFCDSWEVKIISSLPSREVILISDMAGSDAVKKGDYRIIRPDDRVIETSQLPEAIRLGMTLEISIVIWTQTDGRDASTVPVDSRLNRKPSGIGVFAAVASERSSLVVKWNPGEFACI
ncbi:hypothetical protein HWV62_27275 [Athelia sp. TMB]|nr:hypothetical protein HWV62_27275 [Athelia sp. TMB]